MIATYNSRAVRALSRVESRRRSPWRWAPSAAWLFLVDSVALTALSLICLRNLDPKSRDFLSLLRALDVVVAVAAFLALASAFLVGRARWKEWSRSGPTVATSRKTIGAPHRQDTGQTWGRPFPVQSHQLTTHFTAQSRQS